MEQQPQQPHIRDEREARNPLPPGSAKSRRPRWLALPLIAGTGLALAVAVIPPAASEGSPGTDPSSSISAPATPVQPGTTNPTDPLPDGSAQPATGDISSPAAGSTPTPEAPPTTPTLSNDASASQPLALKFPAADIDMAILALTPSATELASQQLVPPLTLDAYWLTPYGSPGPESADTTYIVGHSWDGKDAPFNRLSDKSLLGSEFTLTTQGGAITYVVESVITHDKDTLKDSDIWNVTPHRVVLISCYTEDPWGKNVVITALPKST